MSVQIVEAELDRLGDLWSNGLAETYRSYVDALSDHDPALQPKLALAASLIEVGLRLQGLGGRAAPPPTLLMGDLCLARGSRLLTEAASKPVQVAFARAIEGLSAAAASGKPSAPVRELLLHAFTATE
jgi:hypothetical protein